MIKIGNITIGITISIKMPAARIPTIGFQAAY